MTYSYSKRKTCTVCPRSSDLFNEVTYYIKWAITSWTYSICFNTVTLKKQKDRIDFAIDTNTK